MAFRHGGWVMFSLMSLAPSRGTASTGEAYKKFRVSASEAGSSHRQLSKKHLQSPSLPLTRLATPIPKLISRTLP